SRPPSSTCISRATASSYCRSSPKKSPRRCVVSSMGRPPIGKQAMTGTERMRRHRAQFRHEPVTKQDDKPVTKPVTEPSAPAQPGLCAACVEALAQEYENHILVLREALANECYQHDVTRRLYHRALTAFEALVVKQGERVPKPNGSTTSQR